MLGRMPIEYHIVVFIHILAGIIGAFLAFPVAIGAKKGSFIHVTAGKIFVISFVAICITGYILDYENIKNFYFLAESSTLDKNIYSHRNFILFTAMINTFALYLVLSGWRIAHQHYKGYTDLFDKVFNISLATVLIIASCIFFLVGIESLSYIEEKDHFYLNKKIFATILAFLAVGGIAEAALDIAKTLGFLHIKRWWIEHMRKMLLAQLGLLSAFLYRCLPSKKYWLLLTLILALLFLLFFVFMIFRMSNSKNQKLLH